MAPHSQPQTVHESPRNNTAAPTRTLLSLFNPCGRFDQQVARVYQLGTLHEPCKEPINFYLAQHLLQTRKPHLLSIRYPPPLQQHRRRRSSQSNETAKPAPISLEKKEDKTKKERKRDAEMPSSCKDIRMLYCISTTHNSS